MRLKSDPQGYLDWSVASRAKIVLAYEEKYNRISEILDSNPKLIELCHKDLGRLSRDGFGTRPGRKAEYTTENIVRALVVQMIEGTSLRETIVRIAHSPFLQNFVRLGLRKVMDFTLLDKCFKAIEPATWKLVNAELRDYAFQSGRIDPSKIRADTTVMEVNIHYPTTESLLWDSWRTLYRLFSRARAVVPELIENRFHSRKVRKLQLTITRYIKSTSKKCQRRVKKAQKKLLWQVSRIADAAEGLLGALRCSGALELQAVVAELEHFLPLVRKVIAQAERSWIEGQEVLSSERIYSIFEPHTELIKRGRHAKPVEFGHMVLLAQCPEKFITQYDVMERRIPDSRLLDDVIEEHEAAFGAPPDELAADRGFRGEPGAMARWRGKVEFVAIPEREKDWADGALVEAQQFRAGIEGSISVLKRVFRILRCPYRSFKSFAAFAGLAVFTHNLVNLACGP